MLAVDEECHSKKTRVLDKVKLSECPCCQGSEFEAVRQGYDDRLGYPDIFSIVLCKACHYVFIQDPIKLDLVPELYSRYYPENPISNNDSVVPAKRFRELFERSKWFTVLEGAPDLSIFIKSGESVLDVGCSYGASANAARDKGALWTGIEIDHRCCEYLKSNALRYFMGTLEKYSDISKEKFTTIMLSQVLEHVPEPISTLKVAKKLLNDNGRILVSMPNYQSRYKEKYRELWLHWHIPYHVGQWSKKSLGFACDKAGLRITRFYTVTFFAWWRVQRALRPTRQGVANPSYPGGSLPTWMRRSGLAILYHVVVDIYQRILDLFGHGDVIMAELKIDNNSLSLQIGKDENQLA